MSSPASTLRATEEGAVSIETALSLFIAILATMGCIGFCMMAYTYGILQDACEHGVQYAQTHGTDSSSCSGPSPGCGDTTATNVVAYVTAYAGNYMSAVSSSEVTVSYPDSSSAPPSRVHVAIAHPYTALTYLRIPAPTVTVSSEGRIIY